MARSWMLENVVVVARDNTASFFIPSEAERMSRTVGDTVRLHFLLTDPQADQPRAERMWVDIISRETTPPTYIGVLGNQPRYITGLKLGDQITFGPDTSHKCSFGCPILAGLMRLRRERLYPMMQCKYPCPCCGYLVFDESPGSYEICPICYWEDDLSQLRFALTTGANHVSLVEAQENFSKEGVCEPRFHSNVRAPSASDRREPQWRRLEVLKDNVEEPVGGIDYGNTYPDDLTQLYYWRDNYWRRQG